MGGAIVFQPSWRSKQISFIASVCCRPIKTEDMLSLTFNKQFEKRFQLSTSKHIFLFGIKSILLPSSNL